MPLSLDKRRFSKQAERNLWSDRRYYESECFLAARDLHLIHQDVSDFQYLLVAMGTLLIPDLGEHCSRADCGQVDFLPFKCDGCAEVSRPFFLR